MWLIASFDNISLSVCCGFCLRLGLTRNNIHHVQDDEAVVVGFDIIVDESKMSLWLMSLSHTSYTKFDAEDVM